MRDVGIFPALDDGAVCRCATSGCCNITNNLPTNGQYRDYHVIMRPRNARSNLNKRNNVQFSLPIKSHKIRTVNDVNWTLLHSAAYNTYVLFAFELQVHQEVRWLCARCRTRPGLVRTHTSDTTMTPLMASANRSITVAALATTTTFLISSTAWLCVAHSLGPLPGVPVCISLLIMHSCLEFDTQRILSSC